jgi:hypothetical protein
MRHATTIGSNACGATFRRPARVAGCLASPSSRSLRPATAGTDLRFRPLAFAVMSVRGPLLDRSVRPSSSASWSGGTAVSAP